MLPIDVGVVQDCCDWTPGVSTIPGKGVYAHCALEYDDDTMFVIGESADTRRERERERKKLLTILPSPLQYNLFCVRVLRLL